MPPPFSFILRDPNRPDDEEYIVRLIGQVITVSVETMKIVNALPALEASTAGNEGTGPRVSSSG